MSHAEDGTKSANSHSGKSMAQKPACERGPIGRASAFAVAIDSTLSLRLRSLRATGGALISRRISDQARAVPLGVNEPMMEHAMAERASGGMGPAASDSRAMRTTPAPNTDDAAAPAGAAPRDSEGFRLNRMESSAADLDRTSPANEQVRDLVRCKPPRLRKEGWTMQLRPACRAHRIAGQSRDEEGGGYGMVRIETRTRERERRFRRERGRGNIGSTRSVSMSDCARGQRYPPCLPKAAALARQVTATSGASYGRHHPRCSGRRMTCRSGSYPL